jgi:choice-of-anchor B domain-containing protein
VQAVNTLANKKLQKIRYKLFTLFNLWLHWIDQINSDNKNNMSQKSILLALALASYFVPNVANAHAEHDKARYVAINGVDKGNCNTPVRPCKSISYAVSRAAKGDKVLVSTGEYRLNNESELFYLTSQLVPVTGGYNRFDHFQVQSPDINKTTIVGAPLEMHERLHQAGFKVIADRKGVSRDLKNRLSRNKALFEAQSNQSCENGRAGAFSCNKVDLIAHVPLPTSADGSDVWGHVDLNTGIEYAIMVYEDGTRVYSLENPSSPQLVGFIAGKDTSWRDVKVLQYFDKDLSIYRAYAYVTSETTNGIQIINLNNLPESVTLQQADFDMPTSHNVYISNVDYTLNTPLSGLVPKLQIVGGSRFGGAFTTYDLTQPAEPERTYNTGISSRSNYTHDATNILLDDERATRDCSNSVNGMCDVFIDFNEDEIRIWDATDTSNTTRLGSVTYDEVSANQKYVHSGWWHENKRYVYAHDEFDETYGGLNTTVRILDLADLKNPTIVGKWVSDNPTIDHNGFVRGNRYYMSNYERGLTILDISDPVNPVEVGYFDTFPSSNNASFNGAWGAYPYLPSGLILISDINSGLYVLKDRTRDGLAQVGFSTAEQTAERGQQMTVTVNKPVSTADAATVYFDIVNGSGQIGQDVRVVNTSNMLSWEANDNEAKTITLDMVNTGETTPKDFFVKLHNASGNLQLSDQYLHKIKINGESSQGRVGFVREQVSFSEVDGQVTISVQRIGGTRGQVSFDYQANYNTATAEDVDFNSGTLTWPDGDASNKTISFALVDDDLTEDAENFEILLSNGDANLLGTKAITVEIKDNDSNTAPTVYAGNNIEMSTNATATFNAARVTDAENDNVTYLWQKVSGVNVTLSDTAKLNAKITATSEAGVAIIRLTATDSHGASASSELTVTVVAPTPTPTPTQPTTSSGGSSGGSMPVWLLTALTLIGLRRRG